MEWLTLAVWIVVVMVAVPLGAAAVSAPALGGAPLAGFAGVALVVLWIVLDTAQGWLAWASIGAAAVGCAATGAGAYDLVSEERSVSNQALAEHGALLAGVALPMFAAAAAMSLLLATIA